MSESENFRLITVSELLDALEADRDALRQLKKDTQSEMSQRSLTESLLALDDIRNRLYRWARRINNERTYKREPLPPYPIPNFLDLTKKETGCNPPKGKTVRSAQKFWTLLRDYHSSNPEFEVAIPYVQITEDEVKSVQLIWSSIFPRVQLVVIFFEDGHVEHEIQWTMDGSETLVTGKYERTDENSLNTFLSFLTSYKNKITNMKGEQ